MHQIGTVFIGYTVRANRILLKGGILKQKLKFFSLKKKSHLGVVQSKLVQLRRVTDGSEASSRRAIFMIVREKIANLHHLNHILNVFAFWSHLKNQIATV